jgi:hypothetical protein
MPSLAQQALMLDVLTGDMDREFPNAARAYREEAAASPDKWRWCIQEAARHRPKEVPMSESDAMKLEPCPFAGDNREHEVEFIERPCMVECSCGAAGPDAIDQEQAVRFWNTRLSPPPPAVGGEVEERLRAAIYNPAESINRLNRDYLGRLVREAWVRWAEKQQDPKPTWLVPYDKLCEPDKEVDRQIGVDLARIGAATWVADNRFDLVAALTPQGGQKP